MAQKFTVPVTIKNLSSAGSDGLTVFLDQESFARLKVEAGGRITWGDGAGAGDTNLYRDAASVLKTDDTFKAAGLFVSGTEIDTVGATTGDALVFNGTKFVSASVAAGGGASLTVSDTPPAGAEEGDLWFSSLELEVYVYYSSAWIQVTDSNSGVQELYELVDVLIDDPVPGQTLVYNGTEWINSLTSVTAAASLENARVISLSGDVSGSVSFDGSQNVSIAATIQPNSVALGTDTTGNYMSDLTQGTGVTITHTPSEGSNATIAIGQAVGTSSSVTFANVTADLVGDVTGNADTATALETARTIELSGDVSGSASFDGTSNINIFTTVNTASVAIGELYGVNITNPEEFQTLEYNGTEWVNTYSSLVSYVRNAEATTITTGTPVYLFGSTGDHASVKRADNSSDTTSSKTVGVAGSNISASENGPVVTRGYVDGINLSVGYNPGDVLWLGKNGQFTTAKPSAPDHLVFIGVVVRASNNGIIYVATQNGYELEELHDVKLTSPTDGQFLRYNSASTVWVNDTINLGTDTAGDYVQNLVAGTGVTLTNNSGESATPTVAIGQDVATSASVTFARLIVQGDMEVQGTITRLNETNLDVDTAFIYLNANSASANPDMGIAFNYDDGTYRHAGTTGNYVADVSGGTGVTVTHTPGEGTTPSIAIGQDVAASASVSFAAVTAPLIGNVTGNADTATTLATSRTIELTGDVTGSVSFNGSANASITTAIAANSVALGTDTTGSYMLDLTAGTGLTVSHTQSEGSTATVSLNATLDDLSNVSASSPSDGQFLKYLSASSSWVPAAIPTINALDDIGNVTVPSPTVGQFLQWNGSAWVNADVSTNVMTSSQTAAIIIMDIGA
jgi:hypothetical protein